MRRIKILNTNLKVSRVVLIAVTFTICVLALIAHVRTAMGEPIGDQFFIYRIASALSIFIGDPSSTLKGMAEAKSQILLDAVIAVLLGSLAIGTIKSLVDEIYSNATKEIERRIFFDLAKRGYNYEDADEQKVLSGIMVSPERSPTDDEIDQAANLLGDDYEYFYKEYGFASGKMKGVVKMFDFLRRFHFIRPFFFFIPFIYVLKVGLATT